MSDSPHTHFYRCLSLHTPLLCASPLFSHQWVDPVSKPKSYSNITKRPVFPLSLCVFVCVWLTELGLYVTVCCGALPSIILCVCGCVIISSVCVCLCLGFCTLYSEQQRERRQSGSCHWLQWLFSHRKHLQEFRCSSISCSHITLTFHRRPEEISQTHTAQRWNLTDRA